MAVGVGDIIQTLEKIPDLAKKLGKGYICLGLLILLLMYAFKLNWFEIYTVLSWNDIGIFVVAVAFLFSSLFYISELLSKLLTNWRAYKAERNKLHTLNKQQQTYLSNMMRYPKHSHYFPKTPHLEELVKYNIVAGSNTRQPGTERNRMDTGTPFEYTLKPWVVEYLQEHPKLLED